MRLMLTTTAVALAISVTACNNGADDRAANLAEGNDAVTNDMAVANDVGDSTAPIPTSSPEFVAAIAASDEFEIESGKLAAAKATTPELKAFGGMLVTDHQKAATLLRNAAANAGPAISVPSSMPAEQQAMLDSLKSATGAEFDKMFVDQQMKAHSRALSTLNAYTQVGDRPALKTFAMNAQGVIQEHLDQLIGMKR